MDINKLGPGQRIAAGAAVLLFIDMFLSWYGASAFGVSVSLSAWEAFSWTDLLMTLTILVALAMAAQAMGLLAIPVRLSNILLPLAAVVTLIVLYRLINQPGPNDVVDDRFGAFLGFLLLAALTYGALRARDEHEAVSAPGTYRVGDHAGTPAPAAGPTAPPAATTPPPPATPPVEPRPAPGTPPADPPPPGASTP